MLRKVSVRALKRANKWCRAGHRLAKVWAKTIGEPEEVDAFDVTRALKAATEQGLVTYRDHYKAIDAILGLLDDDIVVELQGRFETTKPLREFLRSGISEDAQIEVLYETLERYSDAAD